MKDMITHKQNGYLAKSFDTEDLKKGIETILYHKSYNQIAQNAVQTVNSYFECTKIAQKYIDLYKSILT